MTDVRDTAGKKSAVPALEEQITKKKGERDNLKKSKGRMHKLCCVSGFPSVPRACQALSKFRPFAHTILLA